jgi:hypothetical protein
MTINGIKIRAIVWVTGKEWKILKGRYPLGEWTDLLAAAVTAHDVTHHDIFLEGQGGRVVLISGMVIRCDEIEEDVIPTLLDFLDGLVSP